MMQFNSTAQFVRDCVLNGIGCLLFCAPFSANGKAGTHTANISQYFSQAGFYLRAAIAIEAPQIMVEVEREEARQLELKLPA